MNRSRITIKDIAQMSGVSTQTVSRVINGRPDVSPETRKLIESTIASTGYQPSAVARSLVRRRSQTLGVIIAGLRYFGVAQTLNGITDEAQKADYGVLLKEIDPNDDVGIVPVIEFLLAHQVEGIIVAVPQLAWRVTRAGSSLRIGSSTIAGAPPMIFLKSDPSEAVSTIAIDNRGGAAMATRHLLALGRRRIGHLAGPASWGESREREDGWRAALKDAGLRPGPVVAGDWSAASGADGFARLFAEAPQLDGLFVANDQMAVGALRAAEAAGIAVPDRVALVGFDGLEEGAQLTPSLTTVVQPLRELGELAVRELHAMSHGQDGRSAVRSQVLTTGLLIRESAPAPTGRPRAQRGGVGAATGTARSGTRS